MRFFFVIDTTVIHLLLFMIRIPVQRHVNIFGYINAALPDSYSYLPVHSKGIVCESTISDRASGVGSTELHYKRYQPVAT